MTVRTFMPALAIAITVTALGGSRARRTAPRCYSVGWTVDELSVGRPSDSRRPGTFVSDPAEDERVRVVITEHTLDERSVYFWARLSPRYPTVEVRVADVCLDAGTAVLLAGLIRALVATALAEGRRGTPTAAVPARQVAAALAAAARRGLAGAGAGPFTGQAARANPS